MDRWAGLAAGSPGLQVGDLRRPILTDVGRTKMGDIAKNSRDPIKIAAANDADRPIVIHPANNDLFIRTGRQVIEACGLHIGIELWIKELDEMIKMITQWCESHGDAIQSCCVAPLGPRMAVFVVPQTRSFNFDLADELARLNVELVQTFNVGMVETHQIPATELNRFVDPAIAKWVYGRTSASHQSVEA